MTYNMTSVAAARSVNGIIAGVNDASGGLFTVLTLVSVSVILFMALIRQNPPADSLFATGMVTSIIALLFYGLGWTSVVWVVAYVAITAVGAVGMVKG